jgi:hypothetical protein
MRGFGEWSPSSSLFIAIEFHNNSLRLWLHNNNIHCEWAQPCNTHFDINWNVEIFENYIFFQITKFCEGGLVKFFEDFFCWNEIHNWQWWWKWNTIHFYATHNHNDNGKCYNVFFFSPFQIIMFNVSGDGGGSRKGEGGGK